MAERPAPLRTIALLALLVALALAALPENRFDLLDPAAYALGWRRLAVFLDAFGRPDLSPTTLKLALSLCTKTLAIAFWGTVLGTLVGVMLGFGASRTAMTHDSAAALPARFIVGSCRLILDILRGVPDFAWAIVILTVPGPGPVTGILALSLANAGTLGKIYSELWDELPPKRLEFIRSTGANRIKIFLYALVPLTAPSLTSYTLMRFECSIRNAAVIGVVGGGGLGAQLLDEFTFGNFPRVVTLLLTMLVLTGTTDLLANHLRLRLLRHPRASTSAGISLRSRRQIAALIFVAAAIATLFDLHQDISRSLNELYRLDGRFLREELAQLLQPDLAIDTWREGFASARVPLALGLTATLGAVLVASLLAFPSSVTLQMQSLNFNGEAQTPGKRIVLTTAVLATRGLALVMRAIPSVAWLLIFTAFFTLGILPGLLAITVHSAGVLSRVFVERVDDVPHTRLERAYGGSSLLTFAYAAVPESARSWLSYAAFEFESNVRAGFVLGILGIGGLGDLFHTSLTHWSPHRASTFLIIMVLMTIAIDRTARRLRRS